MIQQLACFMSFVSLVVVLFLAVKLHRIYLKTKVYYSRKMEKMKLTQSKLDNAKSELQSMAELRSWIPKTKGIFDLDNPEDKYVN